MRVYVHCPGQDTGGQAYRIKKAFDRHYPEVAVRALAVSPTYLDYPADLMLYDVGTRYAQRLYHEADLVHVNNTFLGFRRLGMTEPKPMIIHHHGTQFREEHRKMTADADARGVRQFVSTLDLKALEPSTTWMPSPFHLEELAEIREREYRPSDELTIVHSPTDRTIKSTEKLVKAVASLRRGRRKIKLDLIEKVPWSECLRRKARADISFDQVILGYGNNAIEAWAMGIPVIAGIDDEVVPGTRELMLAEFGGQLPFYEATEDTIREALDAMRDPDLRAEYARRGLEHVWRFHDERKVAAQLLEVYQSIVPEHAHHRPEWHWMREMLRVGSAAAAVLT